MALTQTHASDFQPGTKVYYPQHGVGTLTSTEQAVVAGIPLTLYVITFPRDEMTMKIPTHKAGRAGLVTLTDSRWNAQVTHALEIMVQPQKTPKASWKRKADEYGQKINLGTLQALAEVIRDINRDRDDPATNSPSESEFLREAGQRLVDFLTAFWQQKDNEVQQFLNAHLKQHGKTTLRFEHW